MPEHPSAHTAAEAADPGTDPARLAELAQEYPQLRAAIAANPAAYDGLRAWIAQYSEPAVAADPAESPGPLTHEALRQRMAAAATPAADAARDPREPTQSVPLRWGTYALRLLISSIAFALGVGLPSLIEFLGGGYYWNGGPAFGVEVVLSLLLFGAAVVTHPTTVRARALSAIPLFFGLTLEFVLPYFAQLSIYMLLWAVAWFVLRRRPGLAYAALPVGLVIPAAAFLAFLPLFYGSYQWKYFSIVLVQFALLFGVIALGRALGRSAKAPVTPEQRAAAEHSHRVAHLQQWEAAYRSAHDGQDPPAGFLPPAASYGGTSAGGTNVMAILALVFGIGGGLLGIIFGHMARAQIRRTGEAGWGMATAGLVLGYIGTIAGIVALIVYVVILLVVAS